MTLTAVVSLIGFGVLLCLWAGVQAYQRWREGVTNRELEAARRTERRFNSLLGNASDVLVLLGPDGRIEYESPSVVSLLGYRPGLLPNPEKLEFIHPEDRQRSRDVTAQAIRAPGREVRGEIRFRHADGSWRDYVVAARSLLDDPEIQGVILTCHDITERRQAERSLAHREAQLAEAQRLANLGSWEWDLATQQLSWSDEHYRILGLEPGACEPTYDAFMEIVHPEDRERIQSLVAAALGEGVPFECTIRIICPDGDVRVIQSRGAVLHDASGHPTRMVGTAQDVTERHRIVEAFQASERSLQALVGSLDDIVFEFDEDGTYVNIWTRDESLLALPRESLIGRRVTDILGEEVGGPYLELFRRVLATGQPESLEYSLEVGAGKRWFLAGISAVQRSNDGQRTVSMLSRDITERKRVEAELYQAQKLESVGRLAAGIAHEINTPIQFIGDNVHFLRNSFDTLIRLGRTIQVATRAADAGANLAAANRALIADLRAAETEADLDYLADEIPRAIGQTLDGVKQVASIVRAMKEFAHPDGSERVAIDLNHALLSTLTVARSELKYLADVETDLGELPPVPCHASAINQVLLNLLVNAAHAIADLGDHHRGTVRVRTARDGDDVLVEIADTGCGIPDEIKDQIFDQFFTTKEVGRGTGQGLALARRIVVEQHGGTLSFESEVGRGTTFSVRLPLHTYAPDCANGVALGA
jgi:two-component system, NtrC family, sensor kinase